MALAGRKHERATGAIDARATNNRASILTFCGRSKVAVAGVYDEAPPCACCSLAFPKVAQPRMSSLRETQPLGAARGTTTFRRHRHQPSHRERWLGNKGPPPLPPQTSTRKQTIVELNTTNINKQALTVTEHTVLPVPCHRSNGDPSGQPSATPQPPGDALRKMNTMKWKLW